MKNIKTIIVMSAACALSADAAFVFNGNGTITEDATGAFVANYAVTTAGVIGSTTPNFNTNQDELRVSNTYDGGESVNYTIAITGVDSGFIFDGLEISSSNFGGNFSRGPATVGVTVDQEFTLTVGSALATTGNPFNFTSAAGAASTGDVFAAGTMLSSTDTGAGSNDIFTLETGNAATQVFTYADLSTGGLASDSFRVAANFTVVPVPEPSSTALLGLGGLALLARRRR